MAALTSTCSSYRRHAAATNTFSLLIAFRLFNPDISKFSSRVSALRVSMPRYGGAGSSSRSVPGDCRPLKPSNFDDDHALDKSAIRKYRYELQKKKRGQQKKSAGNRIDLKELKMGYNIDVHDSSVHLKAAQKFLKDGDKLKVIVNLKGHENEFRNNVTELIRLFQDDVGELATEESKSIRDRNVFIVLVPNKAVVQKAQEPPQKNQQRLKFQPVLSALGRFVTDFSR